MRVGFHGWKSFFFLLTGKMSMFWAGMTPRLVIVDPELMTEIFSDMPVPLFSQRDWHVKRVRGGRNTEG